MNRTLSSALLIAVFPMTIALAQQTGADTEKTDNDSEEAEYSVTERGLHHRVMQSVTTLTNKLGVVSRTNTYTELATGMHYVTDDGQWAESREEIEILPKGAGAVARHGQHKVIFPSDIYDGAIQMYLPDGQLLRSRVLGLSYYDSATDKSVFIAETTNSVGELHGSNVVIYPDAFTDFRASIRLTYTRAGFEQDIILLQQPPSPKEWDMNPETTRLQVLTEFFDPPQPTKRVEVSTNDKGQAKVDETLDFPGSMQMGFGRAFSLDGSSDDIPVSKQWLKMEGRDFLVEEVEISAVEKKLVTLPRGAALPAGTNVMRQARLGKPSLPTRRQAQVTSKQMRMAKASLSNEGFVLDYVTLNTSLTNYLFKGDTTYYFSGDVNFYGTNTTFEGGAVLKYTNNVSLTVNTPVTWLGASYRPVKMVARDDNTVGETVSGSTGNPSTNYYAANALYFNAATANTNLVLRNIRVANAMRAIAINTKSGHVLSHVQILNCGYGLALTNAEVSVRNALMYLVQTNFTGSSSTGRVEHLTSHQTTRINGNIGSNLFITNSLFAAAPNTSAFTSVNNRTNSASTGIFTNVGAGYHYLVASSTNRNVGTTNINATLLAELKKLTTFPPLVISNLTVSTATNWTIQAQRDTSTNDLPDIGYHYDPLDYAASRVIVTNTTLTLTNGVAVGIFGPYGFYGGALASEGAPTANNQVALYSAVQEQSVIWETNGAATYFLSLPSSPADSRFRFTRFSLAGSAGFCTSANANLTVMDCWLHVANLNIQSGGGKTLRFTNNIVERCTWQFLYCGGPYWAEFHNNLFLNTANGIGHACGMLAPNFTLKNNLFVNGSITHGAGTPQIANNGYYNTTATTLGSGYKTITNLDFQTGALGNYYYPTSGSGLAQLIDAGSANAASLGFYHYTTATNQVKETNSVIDIGFHYLASSATGQVSDFDGDGIVDYIEDANGNGVVDAGETEWRIVITNQPQSQTIVAGSSGTFTVGASGQPLFYQWLFNGTNAIAGATSSSYTISVVSPTNAGLYSVIVSNQFGTVISSNAVLTVTCSATPSGLAGYWQAENNAADSASNLHGIFINASYTNGYAGTAFQFDGTNSYIRMADSSALKPTNLTVEAWVKFDSLSSSVSSPTLAGLQYIVFKQNTRPYTASDFEGYTLAKWTDNKLFFGISSSTGVYKEAVYSTAVVANTWYHVVGVRGSNYIQLYVNGQLRQQTAVSLPQDYGTKPIYFGTSGEPGYDGRLKGKLDEVSFYTRALSSNEISNLYLAGPAGRCPLPAKIEPYNSKALIGAVGTLTAVAGGAPPSGYQWQFTGSNIAGATNATLALANLQSSNSGNYAVFVTNAYGTVSTNTSLTVQACVPALDVMLVIDRSLSMTNAMVSCSNRFHGARIASSNFVANLNTTNDQCGLVYFSDYPSTKSLNLSSQLLSWNQAIQNIPYPSSPGYTHMSDALASAQEELQSVRRNSNALPVIVFLSDGQPTDAGLANVTASSNLVMTVADQLKQRGTLLITVALSSESDTNFMKAVSSSNSFYYANSFSELTNVYSLIANSICRGSSNGFGITLLTPTNGQTYVWSPTNILLSATVYGATSPVVTVEFFASTNRIGAATHLSGGIYSLSWHPVIGGNYQISAKVTDTNGATATSSIASITVNRQPTVSITSPTNGTRIFIPGTNITITASASDSDGSVTNVQFFTNSASLGKDASSPYSIAWNNLQPGTYTLFARATDNQGAASNSAAVTVTVYPANAPPVANAGPDQTIRLPHTTLMNGSASDDGLPLGNTLSFSWSNVGKPSGAQIVFSNSSETITEVWFSKVGIYTNRLIVSDGELTGTNDVVVTVLTTNLPPVVFPGENVVIPDRLATRLAGSVTDDSQPVGGTLVWGWSVAEGSLGSVLFADPNQVDSLVSFDREGTYVLTLTASDGELTTSSNMTVSVISNSVPYRASGYRYRIVWEDEEPNFYQPNYDDATWTNGQAAFGTWDTCPLNNTNIVHTEWPNLTTPTNVSDLVVRKFFTIPPGTTNLSLGLTVDNDAWVYVNGKLITDTNAHWYGLDGYGYWKEYSDTNTVVGRYAHDQCAQYDELKLANLSPQVWSIGTNLLAVRARNTIPQNHPWNPSFLDVRAYLNSPFEFTNGRPTAVTGPDVYTTINTPTLIPGFVVDDGRRNGTSPSTAEWYTNSGPASGYFYTANADTNYLVLNFTNYLPVSFVAKFSQSGDYVLSLRANDGLLQSTNFLTVHVLPSSPPAIPTVTFTSPTDNALFVTDNAIPVAANVTAGSGTITNVAFYARTAWGLLSIGNDTSTPYSVSWSALTGTYIVEAYVSDNLGHVGMTTVTNVQVVNNNSKPIAMVGPDLSIKLTNTVLLTGFVMDDGWPNYFGTATWTNFSGPVGGKVYFTYTNAAFTNFVSDRFTNHAEIAVSAQFSIAGEYVLRLIANDGQTMAYDELTVTVDSGTLTPPIVTLTSPHGNETYGAGTPIHLAANATTTNGTVALIGVFATWSSNSLLVARADDDSLSVNWVPPEGGTYTFTARAFDDSGREGVSDPAAVLVQGRTSANPPTAVPDEFPVLANSVYNVLNPLANDTDADTNDLTIISLGTDGPHGENKARIINSGKNVSFIPEPGYYGPDYFYYTISDGHGGNSTSYVVVNILGAEMPTVAITNPAPNTTVTAGTLITLKTAVTPSGFLGKVEFFRDNIKLGEVTNSPYNLQWYATQNSCGCGIIAVATDIFGQYNTSQPLYLNVVPPTPAAGPRGSIVNLSDVQTNSQGHVYSITPIVTNGLFDLTGTAYATNPGITTVTYSINVLSVTNGSVIKDVTPFPRNADGFYTNTVASAGFLGTLDFTTLQNGVYDLRLVVRAGYEESVVVVRFGLESNLKLGQFSFSEQDVVLPAGTFPLSVTRTYNSLNPSIGEFGYSWTYAINDVDLQIDEERADVEYLFSDNSGAFEPSGDTFSLRVGGGRNVTLTLPDGQRTSFYYYLQPANCGGDDPVNLCADPKWQSAPGVYYDLGLLNPVRLTFLLNSGLEWWSDDASTHAENYDFSGFVLTNRQDGTQYVIEREDLGSYDFLSGTNTGNYAQTYGKARLTRIIQRNQDKIYLHADAMVYVNAGGVTNRTVKFARDPKDRIIAIYDPNSLDANGNSNAPPVVKYEYAGDNLAYVHRLQNRDNPANPIYQSTIYEYTNAAYPHYITSIVDPRGITVARNQYDENGKLIALWDADGKRTQFIHSPSNKVEIVTDRLGNTNSFVYDLRGNVRFTTNALAGTNVLVKAMDYDSANQMTAETNALGSAQVTWSLYAYDEKGFQTNAVNSPDHTNSFVYDEFGNLLKHFDPIGNLTTNGYDGFGDLTNTVTLEGQTNPVSRTYSIYANGRLAETRNANYELTASFGYDTAGNLTSSTDANGVTRYFSYDDNGNQTSSYYFWTPPGGSAIGVTNYTVYDAQGRAIHTVDPLGNTNHTFYSTLGKVDYTVDKFGNTNSFLYDTRGNLIRTTHADGLMTYTVYDEAGRAFLTTDRNGITATRTYFDAAGRATNVVRLTNVVVSIELGPRSVLASEGTPISTNSTEYLDSGWVKSRTGPDGAKTSYAYWADGQTMYVTNVLATNITFYKYDIAGRQEYVTDALNHTNRFQYDALGRMVKTVFHDGTFTTNIFNNLGQRVGVKDQADRLTQFTYDLSGQFTNVTKPQVLDPENSNNPSTPQWSYKYDQYGRLTATTDPRNSSTTNSYDQFGREVTRWLTLGETNWTKYNSLGQVSEIWDFKKQKKKFVYDRFGRIATNYYFEAGATQPSNSVAYLYNQLGQLTNIIERSGTYAGIGYIASVGSPNNRNRFIARLAGIPPRTQGGALGLILCGVAMACVPREKRRAFTLCLVEAWQTSLLTSGGRRLRRAWRRFNAEAQSRQGAGLLATLLAVIRWQHSTRFAEEEGRGGVVHFRKHLRLPSFGWRFATLVTLIAMIGCDPAFDGFWTARASCDIPANPTVTQDERVTTFSYDLDGRLAQVNSPEGVINYAYDLATGRHTRTCTDNSEVEYGYDELGRLKTVHELKRNTYSVNETTTYTYTAVGSRASVTSPNGVVTSYQYDELNRLTNLVNSLGGTNLLSQFSYQLHQTGRRTNATEILKQEDGGRQTNTLSWAFDGLYRLTNEVCVSTVSGASYTNAFSYDKTGNRVKKTRYGSVIETTISYFNMNDQLLREEITPSSGTLSTNYYAYDSNGSLIAKTNATVSTSAPTLYTYDLKNKLNGVAVYGSGDWTTNFFTYNDAGIRVRTVSGGTSTKYLIDANNHTGYAQVLEELSNNGMYTSFRSYVLGDDVLGQADSGVPLRSLLYDGHGSTRQLVDNTGAVTSSYNFDAYGQTLGSSTGTVETSLLYCGEQYDSALNMYNLRARFYDPSNGRFNARDTFMGNNEDPQSLHKYAYCNTDPVNSIDPSGKMSLVEQMVVWTCITIIAVELVSYAVFAFRSGSRRTRSSTDNTYVGDILNEFFSANSTERAWIMGPTDRYTRIVSKWQPVKDAIDRHKDDLRANCGYWDTHHRTDTSWKPGASAARDLNARDEFIPGPDWNTSPPVAAANFSLWRLTGIQTDTLHTSAIGSFNVYATVDKIDCNARKATIRYWMYNRMSRESFGLFAEWRIYKNSGMANQFMWWNWTEDYSW